MKFLKFLILIILMIVLSYISLWFYAAYKISNAVNEYARSKITLLDLPDRKYSGSFSKAKVSGFPFKLIVALHNWCEDSTGTEVHYDSPIYIGYDLSGQNLFFSYNGNINAYYKPVHHSFGTALKIDNYLITIDLPLTRQFISKIKDIKDTIELINYFNNIKITTNKVECFNLADNEKFYDKEYEYLQIFWNPRKYYINLEDLVNNIPSRYNVNYKIKTNYSTTELRRIPPGMLYLFLPIPAVVEMEGDFIFTTNANTVHELAGDLDIQATIKLLSEGINIPALKLAYYQKQTKQKSQLSCNISTSFAIKEGFIKGIVQALQHIYKVLSSISPNAKERMGDKINTLITKIESKIDAIKFDYLENKEYDFNLQSALFTSASDIYFKVEDFSLFTVKNSPQGIKNPKTGIKFSTEGEVSLKNATYWQNKGILYVKNYPVVVDFITYLYLLGKFDSWSGQTKELYLNTNNNFIKQVSDHPESTSGDVSFEYNFNTDNVKKATIGSVVFEQLFSLYKITLYKELIKLIKPEGDIISQMQQISPDLDINEPLLKAILSEIDKNYLYLQEPNQQIDDKLWQNLIK